MQDKEKIHPFDIIVGLENITHLDKLVLFKIYNLDNSNRGCFAKDSWFSALFKVHKKSINRSIARLEKYNLILKTHPDGNRQIKVNLPKGYPAGNPTVTNSLHNSYLGGNTTVDYITKEKTKELNKRESTLSNFDFLIKEKQIDIENIKSEYKLPSKEWKLCIGKFNEKNGKDLSMESFRRFVNNWKNNLKPYDEQHQVLSNRKMIRYSEGERDYMKKFF